MVVDGFAEVVGQLAPPGAGASLRKPLTMILFGMMNWIFTWLRDSGPLSHDDLAPVVADLFIGGLARVREPRGRVAIARARGRGSETAKAMA